MDFGLTDEQRELKAQAREVLSGEPPEWSELGELGWLGVSVSEELGGAGLSFVEEALLHEELGYALYDGPFLATMLALPDLPPEEQRAVAAGNTKWSVEIEGLVPEWGRIDRVLTETGPVEPEGEQLPSIDPTRPLGRLSNPSNKLLQGKSGSAPSHDRRSGTPTPERWSTSASGGRRRKAMSVRTAAVDGSLRRRRAALTRTRTRS